MIPEGWKFIAELPPRRDESIVEKDWNVELLESVDFEGQRFSLPEGLSVKARLHWLEDSLLSVEMSLAASLRGECARCLSEAALAISDDLMYLYCPRGMELEKDIKLQSDDRFLDGFMPVEVDFRGRTLDLSDQVWESLLMLLPVKLLCREDCAGLCPHCGADWNVTACACASEEGDPRFEILRGASVFPAAKKDL